MSFAIRAARKQDISAIVSLESLVFRGDRLSRRSLLEFLNKGSALFLVAEASPAPSSKGVAGYAIALIRSTSAICRLYSVAVSPEYQGRGIARQLIAAAEKAALRQAKTRMRLEVRFDNKAAIALYRKLGYTRFEIKSDYYVDGADALRFEKSLN